MSTLELKGKHTQITVICNLCRSPLEARLIGEGVCDPIIEVEWCSYCTTAMGWKIVEVDRDAIRYGD